MKNGFAVFETLIVIAVIALIGLFLWSASKTHDEFEKACDLSGGTTVWDGRQNQCIKRPIDAH